MLSKDQELSNALNMNDWLSVCDEFKRFDFQSIKEAEFSVIYTAYSKVYEAIIESNPEEKHNDEEISLLLKLNADILHQLRFLNTKLCILEISHHFPLLKTFYQKAEMSEPVANHFFEGLPANVHDEIFGNIDANGQYNLGYINLMEDKETKSTLASVNHEGYRLFNEPKINKLLVAILTGNQDKAKSLIKNNLLLLLEEGCAPDYSNQTFYNASPMGITRWLGDVRYMGNMIVDCVEEDESLSPEDKELLLNTLLAQIKAVKEQGLTYRASNGELKTNQKPFDYSELISALQVYIDNYDNWDWTQREAHWCKVVGLAQRHLPAHVVAHYCDPDIPFYPTPAFDKDKRPQCLDFYNYLTKKTEFWFAPVTESGALGENFGVAGGWCRSGARSRGLAAGWDGGAIAALRDKREADAELLTQRIQNLLQKPDMAQAPKREI